MKMRLKIIFLFVVVLILIRFVAAGCEENQRIMRLYSQTNSHGAVFDGAVYNIDVCYNDIFGKNYEGTNQHDCAEKTPILKLSESTNAHAEIASLNNYNTRICYGDLNCIARENQECNAQNNEKLIVSLSSQTNAHLANDSSYFIKICCTATAVICNNNGACDSGETPENCLNDCPISGDAYWADIGENPVNKTNIKDNVKLIVDIGGIKGKTINYVIKKQEDGGFEWLDWLIPDPIIAQFPSRGFAKWKAGEKDDGTLKEGDFYFIAKVDGIEYHSKDTPGYGILKVFSALDNAMPATQIVKPAPESHHILTEEIFFEQVSYDPDDDLKLIWDFGDGNSKTFDNCLSGTDCNTTHNYDSPGTRLIKLTAQEMTRNQKAVDKKIIYLHREGLNIFAIIDSPAYNYPVKAGSYIIDGRSSYVENCSALCPADGIGECYDVIDNGMTLKCRRIANSGQLSFEWKIDGVIDAEHTNNTQFERIFVEPREHIINLKVSYDY